MLIAVARNASVAWICLVPGAGQARHLATAAVLPQRTDTGRGVQRLKELQETGAREQDNLDRLQDLCISLEQDREAFQGSLVRAEKLHKNLQSRCSSTLRAGDGRMSCRAMPMTPCAALC